MAKLTTKQIKQQAKTQKKVDKKAAKVEHKRTTPGVFRSIPQQQKQYSLLTPGQQRLQDIIQSLTGNSLQHLNLPGSQQGSFDPIRQRAQGDFENKTIPSLAERFLQMGSAQSRPSDYSGFAQQLFNSQGDLNANLAALESQHNLQQQGLQSNNLANLLNATLGQQFDYSIMPEQPSLLKRGFQAAAPAAINAGIGFITGGPAGAALGALGGLMKGSSGQQQSPQIYQHQLGINGINNSVSQGYAQKMMPQQGQPLGVQNINNSILNGYNNNLINQSHHLYDPTYNPNPYTSGFKSNNDISNYYGY